MAPVIVQLMRHGQVASHRGDVSITPEGSEEVEAAGQSLAATICSDEVVHILTTSTMRSRETAGVFHRSLVKELGEVRPEIRTPVEEWAIRNPDLFLAGQRVEMVSTAEAMAEQLSGLGLDAEAIDGIPFYREFFRHPDRVGFWLNEAHPPGENADAVARRTITWAASLFQRRQNRTQRYICITHSPVMRAVLRQYLLAIDPDEPWWIESINITVIDGGAIIGYRNQRATVATP